MMVLIKVHIASLLDKNFGKENINKNNTSESFYC